MSAREKIAYLKGLIDGQSLADTLEKEKFYSALTDAMDSLAEALEQHEQVHQELNDYLEQLDEDVCSIEDVLDDECDCGCHDFDDDEDDDEDYENVDDEEYASVTCPHCKKEFYYEPAMYGDDEDLLCPHCGKDFKIPD